MPTYIAPEEDSPLRVMVDPKDIDSVISMLRDALSPKVLFIPDILEMSTMAHDVKNFTIQSAIDILEKYNVGW